MGGIEGALGGPRLLEASPRRRGGRVVGCLVASRGGGCARGVRWRWRCSCGRGKGEAGERAEGVLRWSHQWVTTRNGSLSGARKSVACPACSSCAEGDSVARTRLMYTASTTARGLLVRLGVVTLHPTYHLSNLTIASRLIHLEIVCGSMLKGLEVHRAIAMQVPILSG